MSDSKPRMPPLTLDFDYNERIRLQVPIWWTLVTVIWDIQHPEPPWKIRLLVPYQTSFKAEWMDEFKRIHNDGVDFARKTGQNKGLMECLRNRKFNQWILEQYHAPPQEYHVRMRQRILLYDPKGQKNGLTDVHPREQTPETPTYTEATRTSKSLTKAARETNKTENGKNLSLECASSKQQKPPKFQTLKTTFNTGFYPMRNIQFR